MIGLGPALRPRGRHPPVSRYRTTSTVYFPICASEILCTERPFRSRLPVRTATISRFPAGYVEYYPLTAKPYGPVVGEPAWHKMQILSINQCRSTSKVSARPGNIRGIQSPPTVTSSGGRACRHGFGLSTDTTGVWTKTLDARTIPDRGWH